MHVFADQDEEMEFRISDLIRVGLTKDLMIKGHEHSCTRLTPSNEAVKAPLVPERLRSV